jgi:hypothetical protein
MKLNCEKGEIIFYCKNGIAVTEPGGMDLFFLIFCVISEASF